MENRYTKQAREALDAAEVYAKELKHPYMVRSICLWD